MSNHYLAPEGCILKTGILPLYFFSVSLSLWFRCSFLVKVMGRSAPKTVLFLCTGNYYRSRFAEHLFNATADKLGLSWQATSRGLAIERGINNMGPMARSALQALHALGIRGPDHDRLPLAVQTTDFEAADRVIALYETEHRPLLEERHPDQVERVEYWHIEDVDGVLPRIESEVNGLIARLLGGTPEVRPPAAQPPAIAAAEKPRDKPLVRVGRETKGRRGKGVTLVSDLPLDEAGIRELASRLKERCGTGGTVRAGTIEIQGDQRERIVAELEQLGYRVKRVGG
jgi:predicted translation initiation factor SUI1